MTAADMARSVLPSDDHTSETSHFTGTVTWVQLDASVDDHDHLISPEERWRVAMALQ